MESIGEIEATPEKIMTDNNGSIVLFLRASKGNAITVERIVSDIKTGLQVGKRLKIAFSWHKEKRSLSANAYFWQLVGKIAEKIAASPNEIYKRFIKELPVYRALEINEDAADTFITAWGMHGIGWIAEKVDHAQTKGFVAIHAYYGSSVYNKVQMARLIDNAVSDAKELGIETLDEKELKELVGSHGIK